MKIFKTMCLTVALFALLSGCSQPGASFGPPPSNADAQAMAQAVALAMTGGINNAKSLGTKALVASGMYYGTGFMMAYTENSLAGGGDTVDLKYNFSGYNYTTITINSGSAELVYTIDGSGNQTFAFTGNFVLTYNGTLYNFTWNLNVNAPIVGPSSYSGNFTINGQVYTYTATGV